MRKIDVLCDFIATDLGETKSDDELFKIQDSNTLVGESLFNESTYRKIKTPSNKQDSER